MIHTSNLSKVSRVEGIESLILQNVNIDIDSGEYVSFLGPSGSGKTTLVNIIGLIDVPTTGNLLYMGHDTSLLSERQRINLRRGSIGYVFRNFGLIDELTVKENIELPLQYLKYSKNIRKTKVEEVLERFNISHRKDYFPRQLSGFQQQMVSIARAVVIKPDLLIADEPIGRLNSSDGGRILDLLSKLNEEGLTVILATHSNSEAEKAQRIIQLFDGHVVTENVINKI